MRTYFKKRATRKIKKRNLRGGFYPSLMGGVLSNGPIFVSAAIAQGVRLVRGSDERLKSRRRRGKTHRKSRRT